MEEGRGWRRELVVQQNRGREERRGEGRGWRRGGDGGESW